jgi:hypothetical protein
VDCSPGTFSAGETAVCSTCVPGRFSLSRASECALCAEGTAQGEAGQPSCVACPAGFSSGGAAGQTSCAVCPAGFSSASRSSNCSRCDEGFYAPSPGLPTCVACAAGKTAAAEGSSTCVRCGEGLYQPATGQRACFSCEAGKYETEDRVTCGACAPERASLAGASKCDRCAENYFLVTSPPSPSSSSLSSSSSGDGECRACPDNMRCDGGIQIPRPVKGYWTDTHASSSDPSLIWEVYRCPRGTCGGGVAVSANLSAVLRSSSGERRQRRRLGVDDDEAETEGTCWELGSLNISSYCDSDELRGCDVGSTGPLCGACMSTFKYSGSLRKCVKCKNSVSFDTHIRKIVGRGVLHHAI